MASQHMEDGSFPVKPKNRSSVPTLCFRIISYLTTRVKHMLKQGYTMINTVLICLEPFGTTLDRINGGTTMNRKRQE